MTVFNIFSGILWAKSDRAKFERAQPIGEKVEPNSPRDSDGEPMREIDQNTDINQSRPLSRDLETETLYDMPTTANAHNSVERKPVHYDASEQSSLMAGLSPEHRQAIV